MKVNKILIEASLLWCVVVNERVFFKCVGVVLVMKRKQPLMTDDYTANTDDGVQVLSDDGMMADGPVAVSQILRYF